MTNLGRERERERESCMSCPWKPLDPWQPLGCTYNLNGSLVVNLV